jgi:hypothetical protein
MPFVRHFDDRLIDEEESEKDSNRKKLDFGEVVQVSLEHIPLQREIRAFALAGDLDQARCLQLFHVVGKGSGADGLMGTHVGASGAALGGNLLENLVAARIGEGARNQGELAVG